MHSNDDIRSTDPLAFAPIPLATGTVWTKKDGTTVSVKAMTVLMQTERGEVVEVPLRRMYGGWWS
jgi:hypothetical protein